MQPPPQVTNGNIFGNAEALTQVSSTRIFLPPLLKKRICKSYKTIEVSDSEDDDDERKAKDFFQENQEIVNIAY